MDVLPIGLSTGCFYRRSIFEVLPAIKASGFDLIEICSYPDHLDYRNREQVEEAAAEIKAQGLQPFSFHAPFAADLDITSPNQARQKASLEEMFVAVRAAALLKSEHFVIHPGPEIAEKLPGEKHWQRLRNCAEILAEIATHCRENGIKMVLENMLSFLLMGGTANLQWLMTTLEPSDPGFCLDTGHAHLEGQLPQIISLFHQQLKMIHAADNWGKKDDHLPPGQGGIDWRNLLANLHRFSFQGVFILELAGDDSKSPQEILAAARQARKFIQDTAARCQPPGNLQTAGKDRG